jgi:hypothetical protein
MARGLVGTFGYSLLLSVKYFLQGPMASVFSESIDCAVLFGSERAEAHTPAQVCARGLPSGLVGPSVGLAWGEHLARISAMRVEGIQRSAFTRGVAQLRLIICCWRLSV